MDALSRLVAGDIAPYGPVGHASVGNMTSTPLGAGETYTGEAELNLLPDALVFCRTDADGTLFLDFSPDGVNWDSFLRYTVHSEVNETHTVVKGPRYFRVRFVNGDTPQTYLRLGVYYGQFRQITLPLSQTVRQDSDAITTRTISEEIGIAAGLFDGYSLIQKYGANSDLDVGAVPEDLWEGGGVYTGFPAVGEPLRAVSTSASDALGGVGAEIVRAAAMTEDWEWVAVTFTLNGTTPVAPDAPYTTTNFIRVHSVRTIQSANGADTAANVGIVTIRHATTATNVFTTLQAGRNQSNTGVYTIPAGHTGYIRRMQTALNGTAIANTPAAAVGYLWVREFGLPYRLLRPFTAGSQSPFVDQTYGGVPFPEKTDITIRLTEVSANDVKVVGGFDILLVQND